MPFENVPASGRDIHSRTWATIDSDRGS